MGPGYYKHHESRAVREAYLMGYLSATCGNPESRCPFKGSTDPRPGARGKAVRTLKRRAWLAGHRDKLSAVAG